MDEELDNIGAERLVNLQRPLARLVVAPLWPPFVWLSQLKGADAQMALFDFLTTRLAR